MNKLALFLTVILGLLVTACATITPVSAQHDFDAYLGKTINDTAIDGAIGSEWDNTGNYTGFAINPQGTADVWTKHDGTILYKAVRFTADSNNPWVAFLLSGTKCIKSGADGALLGHDSYATTGYRDISFNGFTDISVGASQDGTGGITVDSSNIVTFELKKPLSSGGSDGKDTAWTEDSTYALIIMWNSNIHGASGESIAHSNGTLTDKNYSSIQMSYHNFQV